MERLFWLPWFCILAVREKWLEAISEAAGCWHYKFEFKEQPAAGLGHQTNYIAASQDNSATRLLLPSATRVFSLNRFTSSDLNRLTSCMAQGAKAVSEKLRLEVTGRVKVKSCLTTPEKTIGCWPCTVYRTQTKWKRNETKRSYQERGHRAITIVLDCLAVCQATSVWGRAENASWAVCTADTKSHKKRKQPREQQKEISTWPQGPTLQTGPTEILVRADQQGNQDYLGEWWPQ